MKCPGRQLPKTLAFEADKERGVVKLPNFDLEILIREHEGIAGTASIGMQEKLRPPKLNRTRLSALVHPELFLNDGELSEVEMFSCRRTEIIGTLDSINALQEQLW
jgi:hypothetical protein